MDNTILLNKLNKWVGTKGIDYLSEDNGLSACFKWLVPKLPDLGVWFSLSLISASMEYMVEIKTWNGKVVAESEPVDNPSLALCLAIEKLIDKR